MFNMAATSEENPTFFVSLYPTYTPPRNSPIDDISKHKYNKGIYLYASLYVELINSLNIKGLIASRNIIRIINSENNFSKINL